MNAKVCDLEGPAGGDDTVGAPQVPVHAQVRVVEVNHTLTERGDVRETLAVYFPTLMRS